MNRKNPGTRNRDTEEVQRRRVNPDSCALPPDSWLPRASCAGVLELDNSNLSPYGMSVRHSAHKSRIPSMLSFRAVWGVRFGLLAMVGISLHGLVHPPERSSQNSRFIPCEAPSHEKDAPSDNRSSDHGHCPLCAVLHEGFVLASVPFDAEVLLSGNSKSPVFADEPLFTAHPDLETASPRGPPV